MRWFFNNFPVALADFCCRASMELVNETLNYLHDGKWVKMILLCSTSYAVRGRHDAGSGGLTFSSVSKTVGGSFFISFFFFYYVCTRGKLAGPKEILPFLVDLITRNFLRDNSRLPPTFFVCPCSRSPFGQGTVPGRNVKTYREKKTVWIVNVFTIKERQLYKRKKSSLLRNFPGLWKACNEILTAYAAESFILIASASVNLQMEEEANNSKFTAKDPPPLWSGSSDQSSNLSDPHPPPLPRHRTSGEICIAILQWRMIGKPRVSAKYYYFRISPETSRGKCGGAGGRTDGGVRWGGKRAFQYGFF